jgi:phage gp37-like protein
MIATVEAAYLARVAEVLGASIRKPEAIGGAWTADELRRALNNAPTVRIALAGGPIDPERQAAQLTAEFVIYVVSGGVTEAARRLGGPQTIGAYDMLARLIPAFHGHTFPGLGTVAAYRLDNLFSETGLDLGGAVYGVRTRIALSLPGEDVAAGLESFAHFHADYDFPPFAPDLHAAWLAEDHNPAPDAQDDVSIPQP